MSHELKGARAKQAQHPSDPLSGRKHADKRLRRVGLVAALTLSLSAPALPPTASRSMISSSPRRCVMRNARRPMKQSAHSTISEHRDEALLKQAIASNFTDHTLAAGPAARTGRTRLCLAPLPRRRA